MNWWVIFWEHAFISCFFKVRNSYKPSYFWRPNIYKDSEVRVDNNFALYAMANRKALFHFAPIYSKRIFLYICHLLKRSG